MTLSEMIVELTELYKECGNGEVYVLDTYSKTSSKGIVTSIMISETPKPYGEGKNKRNVCLIFIQDDY